MVLKVYMRSCKKMNRARFQKAKAMKVEEIEQADAALRSFSWGNGMSRKRKISFDQDRLVHPPVDRFIFRLSDSGLPARNDHSRQNNEGLVCEYGQIMVDGKLTKYYGLYEIERTATESKLIEARVLRDQSLGIPRGWISTPDGCIVNPRGVPLRGDCA